MPNPRFETHCHAFPVFNRQFIQCNSKVSQRRHGPGPGSLCSLTFNALTGTPLAQLKRKDAWLAYRDAMTNGQIGTSGRLEHQHCILLATSYASAPSTVRDSEMDGIVEVDEASFLNYSKAVGIFPARLESAEARQPNVDFPKSKFLYSLFEIDEANTLTRSFQLSIKPHSASSSHNFFPMKAFCARTVRMFANL